MNIRELDKLNIIPIISMTRSRDKTTGTASFIFQDKNIYNKIFENHLLIGGFIFEVEHILFFSESVELLFENGKPIALIIIFIIKNAEEWQNFEKTIIIYAKTHQLVFNKKKIYEI
jgi:photosystem II reaction center protein Psb28